MFNCKTKLKKPHLPLIHSNYSSISNLSLTSKLEEKAISLQITEYIKLHNLLPQSQSAYRIYHSTGTALLRVKNVILLSMNTLVSILTLHLILSTIQFFFTSYHLSSEYQTMLLNGSSHIFLI